LNEAAIISQPQMENQIDKIADVENDFVGNGFKPFLAGKQIHAIDENNMDWNG
jgi:hypothetical protein